LLRAAACQTASPAFLAADGRSSTRCSAISTRPRPTPHAKRLAKPGDRLDDGAGIAGGPECRQKPRWILSLRREFFANDSSLKKPLPKIACRPDRFDQKAVGNFEHASSEPMPD
jgi:hypothetical protein